jgi:hypothetical protein
MTMRKALEVINAMQAAGVIASYAIAGAVAAYNYVEPALTEDLDILVAFDDARNRGASGLVTLEPIFSYLAERGYREHQKEGIVIEGWQVQFLPAANELDLEALAGAEGVELLIGTEGPVATRVLKPEHLVANCLRVGRPKDLIRITQFLTEGAVDIGALCSVLLRHGLRSAWQDFCARMHIRNPCDAYEVR